MQSIAFWPDKVNTSEAQIRARDKQHLDHGRENLGNARLDILQLYTRFSHNGVPSDLGTDMFVELQEAEIRYPNLARIHYGELIVGHNFVDI